MTLENKPEENYTMDDIDIVAPHFDRWELLSSPYTEGAHIIVFYRDNEPLTHFEVNANVVGDLVTELNKQLVYAAVGDIQGWKLMFPEDKELPPLLHLTSNKGVVATLPLTQKVLVKLVPALLKMYDPSKSTFFSRIWKFMKKYKKTVITFAVLIVGFFVGINFI